MSSAQSTLPANPLAYVKKLRRQQPNLYYQSRRDKNGYPYFPHSTIRFKWTA